MSGRVRHGLAWGVALGASIAVVAGRVLVDGGEPAATLASAPHVPARTTTVTRTVEVPVAAAPRRRRPARRPTPAPRSRTRTAAPVAQPQPAPAAAPRRSAGAPHRKRRHAAAPKAAPAPAGPQQVDGDAVATRYGTIQVRLVLSGSRITDVVTLAAPTDGGERTRQITADSIPRLRQQVLDAQSAQVDGVSGATYTTQGYRQSVQSALDLA